MPTNKLKMAKVVLRFVWMFIQAIPTLLILLELVLFGWSPDSTVFRVLHRPRFSCQNSFKSMEGASFVYSTQVALKRPVIAILLPNPFLQAHRISISAPEESYIHTAEIVYGGRKVTGVSNEYMADESIIRMVRFNHRFIDQQNLEVSLTFVSGIQLGEQECGVKLDSQYLH
jgi:hypothetical protein